MPASLAARSTAKVRAADSRYLRTKTQGSQFIRSMVEAAVTTDTPTLTASTTAPAAYTVTKRLAVGNSNYYSGFRLSGCPQIQTTSPNAQSVGATKVPPSSNAWGGCQRMEFDLIGDGFVFTMQAIANSAYFKIWVDGRPHSLTAQACTSVSGAVAGSTNHFTVAFASNATRRITLEWTALSSSTSLHQGIRLKPTATIMPPSIPSPRFMVIHDSYGWGVSNPVAWADGVMGAWPIVAGRLLGFADIWNFTAVPSTGVLKTDATNSYGNYSSRFDADVIPNLRAGDVLLYMGSVNDGSQAAGATQAQAIADLAYLKNALPGVIIIVGSPMYTATPTASHLRVRDEMQAAATALGLPFVNFMDTTLNVFTGTGYISRNVTDGVLNSTTTLTSATANFTLTDVGQVISGTGITPGTTIASRTNSTTVVLSAAATATASGVALAIANQIGDGNSDVNSEYNNGIHPSTPLGAKGLGYLARQQIAPILGQAA